MTNDLLDQRITSVVLHVDALRSRLRTNGDGGRGGEGTGLANELDDLTAAVAEMAATAEELSRTNEELTRAHQALAAEHARFHALFDLSPTARLVTDRAGMIREANRAAATLFARSATRLHGIPLVVLFVSDDRPTVLRALDQVSSPDRAQHVVRLRRPAAPRRVALLGVAPRSLPGGPDPMVQWSLRDVTYEEEAKAALERALAREQETAEGLRKLNELRDLRLTAVAHDLRSPLTALLCLANILQRDASLDDARRLDAVEKIHQTATDMVTLVSDMLDLARSEHGVMPLERTEADISATVRRAIGQVIDLDAARDPAVDNVPRFDLDLPPLTATVDHRLVERIVANLVANALQHVPADRQIWIRVRDEPDGVLLVIEDDGPGIPREAQAQAFDLFQRGTSSASLGIGLALVQEFAGLHGGWAKVEDRVGGGASFQVLLPASGRTAPAPSSRPD